MKHPFDTRHFWLAVGIAVVCEALIICLAFRWNYLFPSGEVSEVYARYQNVDGIDVSYIKDYKVNDTVFVNVTILEAKDSATWSLISRDLKLPPPPDIPEEVKDLYDPSNAFCYYVMKKDSIDNAGGSARNRDICIHSTAKRTICIFHNVTDKQIDAILYKNLDEITY